MQSAHSKHFTGPYPAVLFVRPRRSPTRLDDFRHPRVFKSSNPDLPCHDASPAKQPRERLMQVRHVTAGETPGLDNATGFDLSCGVKK